MSGKRPEDFAAYLELYPKEVQRLLKQMRQTIKKAAPKAVEKISYGMPAFTLDGMLVWFAAHKSHIGFYPGAGGVAAFKKELAAFDGAKGSIKFPYADPLPLALVARIVKFRVKQNLAKAKAKAPKKTVKKSKKQAS